MNKCTHLNNSNLTFSLQGTHLYKDECTKCYDNQVNVFIIVRSQKKE